MSDIRVDRSDFAKRQAEMSSGWYENVKRTHGDVGAYIAMRYAAYLDRWKEAARFIPHGSRIVDIGGGNHDKTVLEFIKSMKYEYNYVDIDSACVEASARIAASLGMDSSLFKQGFNDDLQFPDKNFEAVFSSHCIEHSCNLLKTFAEVRRILADKGNLLMAVPFGWEVNPEHPYFFGPAEWISLVTNAGFKIRIAQIGCEYPETGYDFFICGQKQSTLSQHSKIDPDDYRKTNFEFIPAAAHSISYSGEIRENHDHTICLGTDWCVEIRVPRSAKEVLPIFQRHDWSGIVRAEWGSQQVVEDLYSWFPFAQPMRIKAPDGGTKDSTVRLSPIGQNPVSAACQGALWGVLVR